MRTTGRWENLFWAAVVASVLLVFALWSGQRTEIEGSVALRSWNGELAVPPAVRAMLYSRSAIIPVLRRRLAALPDERAVAQAKHGEAMRLWREKCAARDEALRVVQVAVRANASDLAACRERLSEAEREAADAFADLELRANALEKLNDPAGLVADLPGAKDAVEAGTDGRFKLAARLGQGPVVLVLAGGAVGGQAAWLRPVDAPRAGRLEMDFSNENLLSMESLRGFAGVPSEER